MKGCDLRYARGLRVKCKCCGSYELVNRDGCIRAHWSAHVHTMDSQHKCCAGSLDKDCEFHAATKAEVARLHR